MRNCGGGGPAGIVVARPILVLHHTAERAWQLLAGAREIAVVGLLAVRAPVPFVGAGRGVKDDDTVVHVAVGDVELVGGPVEGHVGGAAEVLRIVAAAALTLAADLHHELPLARELQNVRVFLPAAAQPDMVCVVDVDAMLEVGPLVALARTAPRRHDVAGGIEFDHRRRGVPDRSGFVWLQRCRAMDDPDVIARVHVNADHGADQPSVRQRPRPRRIHLESWHRRRRGPRLRDAWHERKSDQQRGPHPAPRQFVLERGK